MNRAALWLGATRPAFLSITLLAVLLGFSHAAWRQPAPASLLLVLLTLCGALLAHAAANVLNDVADADSGCDAGNTERVAPFTGGSRVIQQGILSRDAMFRFDWTLLAGSAVCGLALLALTDLRLLGFGIGGLLLAVAYSLPPLKLMSRGLGELVGYRLGALPAVALAALAVMPIGLLASLQIRRFAQTPAQLVSPIRLTLLQAHLVGALLTLGLVGDLFFRTSP